jgi:peptidoglycan/LPS O-acetylase OafA/YrhL
MAEVAATVLAFAVFAGIYAYLKQHPDWSRGEDGKPYSAPGWWIPLAVGWFAILALFVVYAAAEHGFKWGMLLVFPILGGAFALCVLGLKTLGQR